MDVMTARFRTFPARYLDRRWTAEDGIADVSGARSMPGSLRVFHRELGNCEELLAMHNEFIPVDELTPDDDYLVFAHENQGVVSWGFRAEDIGSADPVVWQRNNGDGSWYCEGQTLAPFLESMFDWLLGEGDQSAND